MRKKDGSPVRMEEVTPLIPPPMTPEEMMAQIERMNRQRE